MTVAFVVLAMKVGDRRTDTTIIIPSTLYVINVMWMWRLKAGRFGGTFDPQDSETKSGTVPPKFGRLVTYFTKRLKIKGDSKS